MDGNIIPSLPVDGGTASATRRRSVLPSSTPLPSQRPHGNLNNHVVYFEFHLQ